MNSGPRPIEITQNGVHLRVAHLRELLGPAVLLPWPSGSKGDRRKWKHIQLTSTNDDRYSAQLEKAGNIGVALGKVSNGLVTIDLDSNYHVAPLLGLNPPLAGTLRTAASRGCNIWLRCSGEYPQSCKLTDPSGNKVGEWRADGNQTIISGTHPDGCPYRFVVEAPVIELAYIEIVWPESFKAPKWQSSVQNQQNVVNRVTEVTELQSNKSCVSAHLFIKAVQSASTTDFHQNDAALFRLARAMIDIHRLSGSYPTPGNLKQVFVLWAESNRRFWRPGQSWNDYWIDFLQACKDARHGLTENPLDTAWTRALSLPPPQEALDCFEDSQMHLFISFLRELQILNGDEPIYASTRSIGERFGMSNVSAAKWMNALIPLGILGLATPGTTTRCPRYFYLPLKGRRTSEAFVINPAANSGNRAAA
jgi:hypothetical protein